MPAIAAAAQTPQKINKERSMPLSKEDVVDRSKRKFSASYCQQQCSTRRTALRFAGN
jgi:hypothetical protein